MSPSPPALSRAALVALVAGSALTAIDQGPAVLNGHAPGVWAWPLVLNSAVLFCVAIWSAAANTWHREANDGGVRARGARANDCAK